AGISGQFFKQFALTIAASTVLSAANALTMAPAFAVLLLKPHAHGHGDQREALPRPAVALLAGFVAFEFLVPILAPHFGLETGGHGGHGEPAEHAANPLALWGLRIGVFLVAAVVGWFLSSVVNWVLLRFFDAFNWVFDLVTGGYGRVVHGTLRV